MPNFISKVSLPNDENIYDLKSYKTQGIFYAQVDTTSTSKAFTVTIPELTATEYYDGLTLLLYNGKVTSASGFTINVNGLGAKPSYSNMTLGNPVTPTAPTRDTTIFNINYAMLFVYNSTRVSGGCWICYRGYDANTNTVGYQLRTNSYSLTTLDAFRYYKILFTSADNQHWVPAASSTTNSETSKKTPNSRPINPFGEIVYCGSSTSYAAYAAVSATTCWQEYTVALGYSFNTTGAALTLTSRKPVYVKCTPQADGSAIIDANIPIVQTLPSTEDGSIYILLGIAYAATAIELLMNHPVYYYKDGAIRLWTNPAATGSGLPEVTSTDNDKVLKVVNGDWAVTNEDEIFKISVIAIVISQTEYSMTADKTYAQIVAALNANKICQVCLNFAGPDSPAYDGGYYIFNYSGSNSGILNFIMDMPSTQPTSNPTFINGGTNMGMCLTCSTSAGQDTWKLSIFDYVLAPNEVVGNSTTPIYWDNGFQECSLATVASSGSYNDLSNKPTIPTVYNATLTIQKNGSTVNTFTANASSNVTANITVPTKTSDLIKDDVIPLENGGTGLNAGLADDWYSNNILHPRFEVLYDVDDGRFYIKYTGPLDGISDIYDFRDSEYFKAAVRSLVPMWFGSFGGTFFGTAMVMTGLLAESDFQTIYILFPDAIQQYGRYVNGVKGTLVYDENDGVYMLPSSMQPLTPGWYNPLNTLSNSISSVGYSGSYNDLTDQPTLGTAAAKNTTNTYSSTGTDPITGTGVAAALATLPTPMQFKGTVGSSGTIEWSALPTAAAGNTGYVYKVISDHSTAPICKNGDTIVSNGSSWVVIPSGDEPAGTVTNIATGTDLTGGPITSTGTISHGTYDAVSAAAVKVGRNATGHVVIGDALTYTDVGAAASDHTHTQFENDLTLLKSGTSPGDSYSLIFQRGTLTDSYNDWRIQDREGFLRFDQKGSGSSDWSQQVYFNTSGTVYATAFSGNGASLTNLNASNISSGILADGRLPSTVEKVANKVTSITSASTATQYPSAKAVYDLISSSSIPSILVTAEYTYDGGGHYSFTGNYSVTGPTVSELYTYTQTSGNRMISFNFADKGEYGYNTSIQACAGFISFFNDDTPPTAVTISAHMSQGGASVSDFYVYLTDSASTTTVTKTTYSSVTSINSSSTDTQYPTAKAVYDLFASITDADSISY